MLKTSQLSTKEKLNRNSIFRTFVALLRDEHLTSEDKKLTEYCDIIFYTPDLSHSNIFGALDNNEIFQLGICSVPNRTLNALVCEKLAKKFKDLSICGCFFQLEGCWRLDVNEKLCRSGLLLPRRDKNGWIYGLQVYRYPDDQSPFFLKVRGDYFG